MKVSVIIPAHNADPYLAEALESVLAQTYRGEVEIVVHNDGSTDGTRAVAESFGSKIVLLNSETAGGIAKARNRAIEISRGDHLAFLDADDIWLPHKLEKQVAVLREQGGPAVVFGEIQEFDSEGPRGAYLPAMLPIAALMTRDTFDGIGFFDEGLVLAEFAEWLSRAQDQGVALVTPDFPVARRRIHADNTGRRRQDRRSDYLEVVRRRLARRRAQGSPNDDRL